MGLSWNWGILAAVGGLWLASGTQREKPVLGSDGRSAMIQMLEGEVSTAPADEEKLRRLAQRYLDVGSPGLALSVIERAPRAVGDRPSVGHLYARALLDQGRAADALAAERRVLESCAARAEQGGRACDTWLLASATRRADILQQLVALGVEDAQAHPEASAVAYHHATRQARLAVR